MSAQTVTATRQAMVQASRARTAWRRARRNPSLWVGGALVLAFLVLAAVGPYVAPHDPTAMDLDRKLSAPGAGHWAGTDQFGRDVLSRILHGARMSLLVALMAEAISLGLGVVVGLVSGYAGGTVDLVVQRIVEIMMAFPGLLLALAIVAVLGPGLTSVMLAVGIAGVPAYVRLVRGQVLAARQQEFVEAARAVGAHPWRIMLRHVLPNILSPVVVVATLGMAGAIQATASLSYLGLGAQPPEPAWGTMVAEGQAYIFNAWWMPTIPGLAIALAVLGFNLFGDGLRDLLDPRTRPK